ncbi:MAG: hypothetical protein JSU00_09050 [Acidobacteria bacterium]|nr:hypothetical protein [Acidobacteriota bacterium]
MTNLRSVLFATLFALAPCHLLTPQQHPPATGGVQRTLQFENEEVAVWKSVVPPNTPLTMHTHQHPRVIIALVGGAMRIVNEDGTSESHAWDTGKAYWLAASEGVKRHADQNTGTQPVEVMVVELKKAR